MAWYWIVLIIVCYILTGIVVAPIMYKVKENNQIWDWTDFLCTAVFWPIFVAIYFPVRILGWISVKISKIMFPKLRIDE